MPRKVGLSSQEWLVMMPTMPSRRRTSVRSCRRAGRLNRESIHLHLREANEFDVVILKPFALRSVLESCGSPSNKFVFVDLTRDPCTLVLGMPGVRWIARDDQDRLIFDLLRSLDFAVTAGRTEFSAARSAPACWSEIPASRSSSFSG